MSVYIPSLEGYGDEVIGDAANPLTRLIHRHRHSHPPIRYREGPPLNEGQRFTLLQRHCSKKGRRHEFVVETREGTACLWCGIVRGTK